MQEIPKKWCLAGKANPSQCVRIPPLGKVGETAPAAPVIQPKAQTKPQPPKAAAPANPEKPKKVTAPKPKPAPEPAPVAVTIAAPTKLLTWEEYLAKVRAINGGQS